MSKEKTKSGWSPLTHFTLMAALGVILAGNFAYELVRHGFSWISLALLLLALLVAAFSAADLKRFRLTPAGLAIQHLITRGTRIIPYASIEEIIQTHILKGRGHPGWEILRIRHQGRWDELKFFERAQRDDFLRRLEACRQGDIVNTVGQAELPAARVVTQSQDWVYPWRRAG